MTMIKLFLLLSPLFCFADYKFEGRHFLASYVECDHEAICNTKELILVMHEAVIASGNTILDTCTYIFEPNGLTLVFLLAESHASIHTYPEVDSCFVDCFSCGLNADLEAFHQALTTFLRPRIVCSETFTRDKGK